MNVANTSERSCIFVCSVLRPSKQGSRARKQVMQNTVSVKPTIDANYSTEDASGFFCQYYGPFFIRNGVRITGNRQQPLKMLLVSSINTMDPSLSYDSYYSGKAALLLELPLAGRSLPDVGFASSPLSSARRSHQSASTQFGHSRTDVNA